MDLDGRGEGESRESEKKSNPNPVKESEREEGGANKIMERLQQEIVEEEEGRIIRGPKAIYTPSK